MILAGDIGGTKTNLAVFSSDDGRLGATVVYKSYPSTQYPSLDTILKDFVAEHNQKVTHASFGVAGPVIKGEARISNLSWTICADSLARILGIHSVGLINDLEATAFGIEALEADQLETLNVGSENDRGTRALIAAGTGLGMAIIFNEEGQYRPVASEGGHSDFAARSEVEIDLFRHLSEKFGGHVSYERVLSGPGLFNIYEFLRDMKFAEEPRWLADEIHSGDKTAAVSAAGLSGKSELAVRALDMFAEIYGAMAGNLALIAMATGGVYIGGGIAPKIRTKLSDGAFMKSFEGKGRMSSLLSRIPVRTILNEKTALLGAALNALR